MRQLLIVDDEDSIHYTMESIFERRGYQVRCVSSANKALEIYQKSPADYPLIITDYYMPGMDGMELLRCVKKLNEDVVVIVMTAHGTEKVAVEAMKLGAFDYFTKPFQNDELVLKVDKAFALLDVKKEVKYLKNRCKEGFRFTSFISDSPSMFGVFDKIEKVAIRNVTVLITGESGTGKELVARSIHVNGDRKKGPFVALNCAAIPRDLLENELFGHEKGSYTGADFTTKGKFEIANGGTIFLDEVGDMPMTTQVKLLRALQERKIERVGGATEIDIDVRILAATNRCLKESIEKGEFREDLYYRLNVVNIDIPPLRNRQEDIKPLIEFFVKEFNTRMGRNVSKITKEAIEYLNNYTWPGNVRQLQNTIERIMVMSEDDIITLDDTQRYAELPESNKISIEETKNCTRNTPVIDLQDFTDLNQEELFSLEFKEAQKQVLACFEKNYLLHALNESKGNISKTAQSIGVHRTHLHDKIKEHDIDIEQIKKENRS